MEALKTKKNKIRASRMLEYVILKIGCIDFRNALR
jgi:hypothetical protein